MKLTKEDVNLIIVVFEIYSKTCLDMANNEFKATIT